MTRNLNRDLDAALSGFIVAAILFGVISPWWWLYIAGDLILRIFFPHVLDMTLLRLGRENGRWFFHWFPKQ